MTLKPRVHAFEPAALDLNKVDPRNMRATMMGASCAGQLPRIAQSSMAKTLFEAVVSFKVAC